MKVLLVRNELERGVEIKCLKGFFFLMYKLVGSLYGCCPFLNQEQVNNKAVLEPFVPR